MKMKKRKAGIFLAALVLFLLAACGGSEGQSLQEAETPVSETAGEGMEAVDPEEAAARPSQDRSGQPIVLPEEVERIVSLAPSITETLMNLGCTGQIVAIDTQTQAYGYAELSADLPAVDMMAPDTELLASLEPDVVLTTGMAAVSGTDPYADLRELDICVVSIPSPASLAAIEEDILFLAACVGKEADGEKIAEEFRAEIEEIAAIGNTVTEKKTVYFEVGASPYSYSFGSGTFLNEMLELIGAKNSFADLEGWISVEAESAISRNPEVILTNVNYIEDPAGEILSREGWEAVEAVKTAQVYAIDNQSSSLPNENVIQALKEMAAAVYPELYAEYAE